MRLELIRVFSWVSQNILRIEPTYVVGLGGMTDVQAVELSNSYGSSRPPTPYPPARRGGGYEAR